MENSLYVVVIWEIGWELPHHHGQVWVLQVACSDLSGGGRGESSGKHLKIPAFGGLSPIPLPAGHVTLHSPHSQDSGGSDLDLDPVEAKLFPDSELSGSSQELGGEGLLLGTSSRCRAHLIWQ